MRECVLLLQLIQSLIFPKCDVRISMESFGLMITITAKVAGDYRSMARCFGFFEIEGIANERVLIQHMCEQFNRQCAEYEKEPR